MKVTEAEIGEIARHVGVEEDRFVQEFTRLRPMRDGLALIDKLNGECFFLVDGGCSIQAVKPAQCRGFPNTWNFPGWRAVCEAIPLVINAGA